MSDNLNKKQNIHKTNPKTQKQQHNQKLEQNTKKIIHKRELMTRLEQ